MVKARYERGGGEDGSNREHLSIGLMIARERGTLWTKSTGRARTQPPDMPPGGGELFKTVLQIRFGGTNVVVRWDGG